MSKLSAIAKKVAGNVAVVIAIALGLGMIGYGFYIGFNLWTANLSA